MCFGDRTISVAYLPSPKAASKALEYGGRSGGPDSPWGWSNRSKSRHHDPASPAIDRDPKEKSLESGHWAVPRDIGLEMSILVLKPESINDRAKPGRVEATSLL